jgi:hypothetical protein
MTLATLDNLVRSGQLKPQPAVEGEIDGLVSSGESRLVDAQNATLSLGSRFDLAYNAAHAVAGGAAMARLSFGESLSRLSDAAHTLGLANKQWRVLDLAHRKRNLVEYEGVADIDEHLVAAMIRVTLEVGSRVHALGKR